MFEIRVLPVVHGERLFFGGICLVEIVSAAANEIFPRVDVGSVSGEADDKGLIRKNDADVVAQIAVLAGFVRDQNVLAQLAAQLVVDLLLTEHINGILAGLLIDKLTAIQLFQEKTELLGTDGVINALGGGCCVKQKATDAGLFQPQLGKSGL